MIRRTLLVAALGLALGALSAALLARPSGAAHRKYTIAYLTYVKYGRGGQEAAKRLGVRVLVPTCVAPCSPSDRVALYKSMIARHVDAIVSDGFDPTLKPTFRTVRKAGILLISSGDDIA